MTIEELTKEEKIIKRIEDGKIFKEQLDRIRVKLKDRYPNEPIGENFDTTIIANDLNDLYFKTILEGLKYGRLNYIDSGSFSGSYRVEFDSANLIVNYPATRPLGPTPRLGVEVTTNDDKIEEYFLNYLMDGSLRDKSSEQDEEHYKYASWIVGIPEGMPLESKGVPRGTRFNQLEWCINHFIEEGYGTNHCAITVGCAEGLQRYGWNKRGVGVEQGSTECLRDVFLNIRANKLDLTTIFRSWDLVAGLPENLGGFAMVMEYVVERINTDKRNKQTNIEIGKLKGYCPGLHIYSHNLNLAEAWTNLAEKKKEDVLEK